MTRHSEIKARLWDPPNAVPDQGIDLGGKAVAAAINQIRLRSRFEAAATEYNHGHEVHRSKTTKTQRIIHHVCRHFGVTRDTLLGAHGCTRAALPRHIALYLTRSITNNSYRVIAKSFGFKDPQNVMDRCARVWRLCATDSFVAQQVSLLRTKIEAEFNGQ